MVTHHDSETHLIWYDAEDIGVEGKGWDDTPRYYTRLPRKALGVVREEVWLRGMTGCGLMVRFRTNATEIHVRWTLAHEVTPTPIETAVRQAGLDLYGQDNCGTWYFVDIARPLGRGTNTAMIAHDLDGAIREYMLYLPLQNRVDQLLIGLSEESLFEPVQPRIDHPLVFYGTSIVHGGAAGRPGLCYPSILGRQLGVPTVNLGFPGQGKMDMELADLLGELDASAFVIDCLPNMSTDLVEQRCEPFIERLREHQPTTPIVLVEEAMRGGQMFKPRLMSGLRRKREAQRAGYQHLLAGGITGLHYVKGDGLLGTDGEATLDGLHPGDLGFFRQANALQPTLQAILDD
ncbi:MAG: SGNH/GDSL hydrolase family protein [Phycisphaerae bacterium]